MEVAGGVLVGTLLGCPPAAVTVSAGTMQLSSRRAVGLRRWEAWVRHRVGERPLQTVLAAAERTALLSIPAHASDTAQSLLSAVGPLLDELVFVLSSLLDRRVLATPDLEQSMRDVDLFGRTLRGVLSQRLFPDMAVNVELREAVEMGLEQQFNVALLEERRAFGRLLWERVERPGQDAALDRAAARWARLEERERLGLVVEEVEPLLGRGEELVQCGAELRGLTGAMTPEGKLQVAERWLDACAQVATGGLDDLLPVCVASVLAGGAAALASELAFVEVLSGPRLRASLREGGRAAYAWTTLSSAVAYAASTAAQTTADSSDAPLLVALEDMDADGDQLLLNSFHRDPTPPANASSLGVESAHMYLA